MNLYRDDRRSLDWRIFDSFSSYPSLESRVDLLDDLITFFFLFFLDFIEEMLTVSNYSGGSCTKLWSSRWIT